MKEHSEKEGFELRQWSIILEGVALAIIIFHFFSNMALKTLPFIMVAALLLASFFHFLRYRKFGTSTAFIRAIVIGTLGLYFLAMTIIVQFL